MKIEEVPQDLKFFKNTVIRDVAYAIDSEGNYESVLSDGWDVKHDAITELILLAFLRNLLL